MTDKQRRHYKPVNKGVDLMAPPKFGDKALIAELRRIERLGQEAICIEDWSGFDFDEDFDFFCCAICGTHVGVNAALGPPRYTCVLCEAVYEVDWDMWEARYLQ